MNSLIEQIIIDILKNQLSLTDSRLFIGSQNYKIPPDNNLFIVATTISEQVYSSQSSLISKIVSPAVTESFWNRQEVCSKAMVQIDILSRNTDALTRRWEVVSALQSFYAQQQMEANNCKIARIPSSFVNASGAEGGSNINRFAITVAALIWNIKDVAMPTYDYYDSFRQRVDDEKTIGTANGIIQFKIDSNGISNNIT
jgi:hypothetical protein